MKKALALIILTLLLSACGGSAEPTALPEETDFPQVIAITGKVVPATWATLSAQTGGTVAEVAVQPGDAVAEGDLLVRLDPTDAQLAVQQAEAGLQAAQAQLALLEAGARAEDVAVLEAQVEAAQAAVSQAAAQRDQVRSGVTEAEIAAAQAQVAAAQTAQVAARQAHEQTTACYEVSLPGGGSEEVCPLLGPMEEQAAYNLHAADQALAAAQAQLAALSAGASSQTRAADAAVWAATAQQDAAQAQLDRLQAGASAEEVAVAQAAVTQAEALLEAARVALARCEVRAPFAGTVGAVAVRASELVVPGQPLVTMGDLTALQVETTDLDEIDVVRVTVGQQATITFDALPERALTGRVTRISPMAEPGTGGVRYTAVIALDELDPAIRWGMTAFVDIENEQ